ncbi:11749_t:CDS:10, partial [Racocetra persica]
TIHGNMNLTTFTCEDDDFEFEGHRLNVGDRGDFVLCNKLCEGVGRHRHIDYCKDPTCELGGAKKEGLLEHITAKIGPFPNKKKDYVSHRVFWERTGFKDPYSTNDREEFKKCDHECIDEKHHNKVEGKNPVKSYCTQKIFHPSLDHTSNTTPDGTGYISADGHHFSCENPTISVGNFHIIFVIDKSGSMRSTDCKPLCNITKLLSLKHNHNNRLGAVMEAVFTFIETRKKSRKSTQVGQMAIDRDTVSLILFNEKATVAFENRTLTNSEELLRVMKEYTAEGGTNFANGINKATKLIKTHRDPSKINLILFLSDGCGSAPEEELRHLCQLETDLGFMPFNQKSNNSNVNSLEKMVDIAKEYLPKAYDKDSLKCGYVHAVDEINLINHFTQDHEVKATVRECMHNAGYIEHRQSENLVFISECCRNLLIETLNEHNLSVGSFLIVDCGRIVDLTFRTLLHGMKFSEIIERSDDFCDSSYVNREFLKFLEILPKELDIERIYPTLMQYITGKVREQMEEYEWLIDLEFQTVINIFDLVIKKIIDLIQRYCARTSYAVMFLKGEFSESQYLKTQIRRYFATQIPIIAFPKHSIASIKYSQDNWFISYSHN